MNKFLKISVIFLIIFSWIFSGWPQIFNFPPKIQVAQAAIAIRATGTYVSGTSNLTPGIPAAQVTGDMMILVVGTKPYDGTNSISVATGWTSIGSATDGTVAAGVDVGSMKTELFYKIAISDTETNPQVDNSTNNVSGAVIIVFQKDAGQNWATPVGAGGGDATAGTGFSVTASSNVGHTSGDMLVGYAAIRSDAGTQSSITITATGLTVGTFTESPATDLATTSGGDMAMSGGYVLATAGTASAAPVYASTLAASHTGSAFMIRLRQVAPTFNQAAYRWFNNNDSTQIGSPLTAGQDQATTLSSTGQSFRLRLLLDIGATSLGQDNQFKLMFAAKGGAASCSAVATSTFADVTTSTVMSYYNNSPNDGDLLTASSTSDPGHSGHTVVTQTYEEANNFVATTTIPAGQDGMWDFALYDNGATASTTYCFRVTDSAGTDLNTYTSFPEITTASASTVSCSAATTTTAFGALTTAAIFTSNPSVTSTMSCTYAAGCTLSINDLYAGLYNSTSTGYTIPSPASGNPATTTLVAATEGFGIQGATTTAGSGGNLLINTRYLQTGNVVGGLTTSTLTLASSSAAITSREVLVTHKAAISDLTWPGSYADTITYGCVGNV